MSRFWPTAPPARALAGNSRGRGPGALTFITNINTLTLPVALLNVETGTFGQVNYGFLIAGAVIAMVPCAVLYVALQRFYVSGISAGGIKG